jgi:hypothetical protein
VLRDLLLAEGSWTMTHTEVFVDEERDGFMIDVWDHIPQQMG